MTDLARRFAKHLATLGLAPRPAVVAVSGGPDSLALLHLLHGAGQAWELIVAHVDHGIHPDSARVAESVRQAAKSLGLAYQQTELHLGPDTSETSARDARYRWLKTLARERRAWLFTAHHRDDQVETVLMRVLKGSGPAGLAGIAPVSGTLVRPLLPFGRAEINGWLQSHGVQGWDDPANRDPRHLRSWIRTELLPPLRSRIPVLDRRLVGLAAQAATQRAAWDAVVNLVGLEPARAGEGFRFDARVLRGKPAPLVEALFLAVARRHGLGFGGRSATRVRVMIERSRSGSRVDLTGGWEAQLDFGHVSVRMAPFVESTTPSLVIAGEAGTAEWDGWRISWSPGTPPEQERRVADTVWLEPASYTVRAWRPGDRIRPLGGAGSRLVVRCMQDVHLPESERRQWPVVGRDDEVVWVPQVCRSNLALPREKGTEVTFVRL